MIAHDIGNFADNNLTPAQLNGLIEQARRDREAGRAPRPNLPLPPDFRLANGVAVREDRQRLLVPGDRPRLTVPADRPRLLVPADRPRPNERVMAPGDRR